VSHFVLVHGAWHDSSCWDLLVPELVARGHSAVAVDLPSDQPGLGAAEYADAVEAAMGPAPERCVLVGHSLGGLTVPVVAERRGPEGVAALVLVAALMPQPGVSFNDQVRLDPDIMGAAVGRGQQRHDDRTTSWPEAEAAAGLYQGVAEESSAELVAKGVAGLRRQAWSIGKEVTPLTAWPAVPTTVVVCAADRVVSSERLRERARAVPGAELVELAGGHFPMLTRPAELAEVLHAAARRG
jgi:pimeloyl-ACP methyl ester carboxylesterase